MQSFGLRLLAIASAAAAVIGCSVPFNPGSGSGAPDGPGESPSASEVGVSLEEYEQDVLYTVFDSESNYVVVRGDETELAGIALQSADSLAVEIHLNETGDLSVVASTNFVITVTDRNGDTLGAEVMTDGMTYFVSDVPIPAGMVDDDGISPSVRATVQSDSPELPHAVRAGDAIFEGWGLVRSVETVVDTVSSSGWSGLLKKQAMTSFLTVAASTAGRQIDGYVFDGEYTVFEELGGQSGTILDTMTCAVGSGAACVSAIYDASTNIWEGYKTLQDSWDSRDMASLVFGLPQAAFVIAAGNDQVGIVEKEFAEPLEIRLVDENGSAVAGVGVRLLDPQTATDWVYITNGAGEVTHRWTANSSPGPQSLGISYLGDAHNVIDRSASSRAWDADDAVELDGVLDPSQPPESYGAEIWNNVALRFYFDLDDVLSNDPVGFGPRWYSWQYNFGDSFVPVAGLAPLTFNETHDEYLVDLPSPYVSFVLPQVAGYPTTTSWTNIERGPHMLPILPGKLTYEYKPFASSGEAFPVPITLNVSLRYSAILHDELSGDAADDALTLIALDEWSAPEGANGWLDRFDSWESYLVPTGTVRDGVGNEYTYVNGVRDGEARRYGTGASYPEGGLVEVATFENDLLHGPYTRYNWVGDNDEIRVPYETGNYENGVRTGAWDKYDAPWDRPEDYYVSSSGQYVDDEQHGTFTAYSENGDVHGTCTYDHGELIGCD